MRVLIATIKSWNIKNAEQLKVEYEGLHQVFVISDPEQLNVETVEKIQPDLILFPHWSWMIDANIHKKYRCIVFHMTDLPYGRGGSPLQNLIVRGHTETVISAIQVSSELDAGPLFMKENLCLQGTAEEIMLRASHIIFKKMIPNLLKETIMPIQQQGEPVYFKRRTPAESEIQQDITLEKIYDHIRMLDGEGYPKAFIQYGMHKISFSRASYRNGKIVADVEITDGGDHEE